MSSARPQGRLFRKYVVVLVALVGGVLAASGLVELYLAYSETKRAVIGVEREKAVAAAERIDQFIKEIERHIRGTTHVAGDLQTDTGARVLADQREIDFLQLLRNLPVIMELRHLDTAGKEQLKVSRFALDAFGSGEDFSKSPAFTQTRARATYFSPVYFRNASEPYMTIAVPSGQTAVEVSLAEVSLKAIWDVASQIRIGRLGYAYVVDSRGHLIAHPDVSLVLQMRDLSELPHVKAAREARASRAEDDAFASVGAGLDGTQSLITHASIAALGWFVFVEQPLQEVYAPLRLAVLWGAMIFVIGLGLSVLASVILARRMVAPIRELQEGAARVGKGELDHRIAIRTGDELQALAEEFNRTAAQLQDSHHTLERKVEARTEELTRSVAELQALGKVGQAVNSTLDLDTVLSTIVANAVQISDADAGTIYEYNEALAVFEPRANFGVSEEMVEALRDSGISLGDTIVGKSAVQRAPLQIADVNDESGDVRLRELLGAAGIRAVLAVPLLREDRVVGALSIRRRRAGVFAPSVVSLLQTFASQSVLAIENARLFQQIQAKSAELAAASQHKSQFLANMSHELRTPMNAIIGVSEMLLEDAQDLKRDDEIEPLERILRAAQHLLALINDILDLSKIEAGKMDLNVESVAVGPLVEDVAATIRPIAEKNGNRVEVKCAPGLGSIWADAMRVRQALLNLASNASKFTEKGIVTIEGTRTSKSGRDWISLRVSDTGIGMTQDQIDRLFQDFVQADASTTRKYGGTGLGLAISQRFCRMMGGDITVASEIGRGSTFTINLPAEGVEHSEDLQPARTPEHASGSAGPRDKAPVLVIDDDVTVRQVMERHLAREGFTVVTAANGIEGLARARELHPSAITLDVMMPELDGWTVLAALKGDPALADIPVILVTIVDEKQRGYMLGATEYLVKPVDREKLASILRALCGHAAGRLLVIEDDETARSVIRQSMEREGWTVVEAANGRVGLERLREARPDAIVLDLMMPEMDGFEFVAELREHSEWCKIPVVVVTALDLSEEDHQRLNGEVERVIRKSGHGREHLLQEVSATLADFARREDQSERTHAAA